MLLDDATSEDKDAEDAYMTSMHVLELQEVAITKRMNNFVKLQLREIESLRRHMEGHLAKQREQMQELARLALSRKQTTRYDDPNRSTWSSLESCLMDNVLTDSSGELVDPHRACRRASLESTSKQKDIFMLGAFVTDVVPLPSNPLSPREVKDLFVEERRRLSPSGRWEPGTSNEALHSEDLHQRATRRSSFARTSLMDVELCRLPSFGDDGAKEAGLFRWTADTPEDLYSYVDQGSETANRLALFTHAKSRIRERKDDSKRMSDRDADKVEFERAASMRKNYEDAKKMMKSGVRFGKGTDNLLERLQAGTKVFQEKLAIRRMLHLNRTERFVENPRFQMFIITLIFLNALFIGASSDVSVKGAIESYDSDSNGEYSDAIKSGWWLAIDVGFNSVFLAELLIRMLAYEGRFCVGKDWHWNLFDTFIVLFSVFELSLLSLGLKLSFVRVLRFARVLPSLRMLRLIRFISLVRKLRIMMMAILSSRTMLMWSVVVLILEMFLFSIIFLNGIVQFIADAPPDSTDVERMKEFFGSLPMTILTLFMSVSGGVDYWDVLKLLLTISSGYAILFMLFIIITVLAVLNVINAIFVNDAMETTRMDKDLRMHQELDETKMELERLTSMYLEMDELGRGTINLQDFLKQVERDDMKIAFALMGVHFADGHTFFKHLDVSGNGELSIDEFVIGCIRIKGGGILIDMDVRLKETKAKMKTWMKDHQTALSLVSARVQLLCERFEVTTI